MTNVVFISPYLRNRHAGGGEKHLFDVALALPKEVNITIAIPHEDGEEESDSKRLLDSYQRFYEQFMGVSLQRCRFVISPIFTNAPWWKKIWWTRQFSHLYYVSDGSLFFSLAKRNILHIQTPPHQGPTWLDAIKLRFWSVVSCNSNFTKAIYERYFGHSAKVSVLYPLADAAMFSMKKPKQKIILHVGRFFAHQHSKRQDVLVECFRKLRNEHPQLMRGWKLVMIGAVENPLYYQKIETKVKNMPVDLLVDCDRQQLLHAYARASIFWSATGYQKNDTLEPQSVEHFGKAVVEAMAAGAVPIVTNKGGHKEILSNSFESLLWTTQAQCVQLTALLIKDQVNQQKYRKAVILRAKDFSEARFIGEVKVLFHLNS